MLSSIFLDIIHTYINYFNKENMNNFIFPYFLFSVQILTTSLLCHRIERCTCVPTTSIASIRSTYRRPCHASICQGKRASTERANANWKREVKVLWSRLVYGDLHRLRVLVRTYVRSFVRSTFYPRRRRRRRRCRVTIERQKNDGRCSLEECRGR